MRTGRILTAATLGVLLFSACKKEDKTTTPDEGKPVNTKDILVQTPSLPGNPFSYSNLSLPNYLNTPPVQGQDNTPANNAITDWGATLGRVLFYDKNLSINNTIACASCHQQADAFADVAKLSKGFAGGSTGRNSMSMINARYYPNGKFFWDERAATLEAQTLMPIQDHVEMGMTLDTLIDKLNRITYYPDLFQKAFGDKTISSDRVSKALAQFVRSIVSFNSKYDEGRKNFPANQPPQQLPDFPNFTTEENRGKTLFFGPGGGCGACHGTETFTGPDAKNNGLDNTFTDLGVGKTTGNAADNGKFKVPSLRNVALTHPYMHDGRFATLEEVVEHYNSGVKQSTTLAPQLITPGGQPRRLNLTAEDKAALVAFLKTLTDTQILTDAKYSDPFK